MFKKIFYSITILAMLVGMFGMMGKAGVTPAMAFSATAINNNWGGADRFAVANVHSFHGWTNDFEGFTEEQPLDPETIVGASRTCYANPGAGQFPGNPAHNGASAWETVIVDFNAAFLHMHATTEFDAVLAVFNDNGGFLGAAIDCAYSLPNTGAGTLHNAELVIPVIPGATYYVYMAPSADPAGTDPLTLWVDGAVTPGVRDGAEFVLQNADLWIAEFTYGQGMIVNLCEPDLAGGVAPNRCDQATEPILGATVQAQLSTGGTIYTDTFDGVATGLAGLGTWVSTADGDLFIDVPNPPAGATYTLGISALADAQTPDTIWFSPYHTMSFYQLDPDASLSFFNSLAVNHVFLNRQGVAFNPQVRVAVPGGALPNFELPVDETVNFKIIPGGYYDFEATDNTDIDDDPGAADPDADFYLISKNVDCLNLLATCPLAFDLREPLPGPILPGPFAHPHATIVRNLNFATPAGKYWDIAVGAVGTNFATSEIFPWGDDDELVVSANVPLYMDAVYEDAAIGDYWVLQATTPGPIPSTLAPNLRGAPISWWLLEDLDLFTTLTAPGLLAAPIANEVPWTSAAGNSLTASYEVYSDAAGNILIPRSPMDYFPIDYRPDYWPNPLVIHRATDNDPWVIAFEILPFGYDGTTLAVVDPAYVAGSLTLTGMGIARYEFDRCITEAGDIDVHCPRLLYAISPTDTRMGNHWSWSWVEGLYEIGLTTGTAPGVYTPDGHISRAEMAVFLSRLLSEYSAVPAAPAATGTVFTDVEATQWAAKYIEQLKAYSITEDCLPVAGDQFCPNDYVTRAQMAKFIEKTYRVADVNGFLPVWLTDLGLVNPGVRFVDVPADHWAVWWIDELALDGLTVGCRTEMSGAAFIHYYCPEDFVTRGQMAKFIISGFETVGVIKGNWPILAPER